MTPYLLVDGVRVTAEAIEPERLGFRLRLPAHDIRLISGAARPVDLGGSSDDRQLGVLLRGLRWAHVGGMSMDVSLDSPAFIDGFHHFEVHDPEAGPVRWTTGDAALPVTLLPPWQGDTLLHLVLDCWRGSMHDAPPRPEAALLGGFESLGEDCEFGLAQRHYLAEPPLGLLRWAGIAPGKLLEGLDNDFAGLGDASSTHMVWNGEEYFLRTPYLTMHTNCREQQDMAGAADVLATGRATLRILRRKLLKDIADASRIFVFKSYQASFDEAARQRLLASLRRIGPAGLLCVTTAPPGERRGGAKRVGDRLYAGYVERSIMSRAPFEQWLSICTETAALHARG